MITPRWTGAFPRAHMNVCKYEPRTSSLHQSFRFKAFLCGEQDCSAAIQLVWSDRLFKPQFWGGHLSPLILPQCLLQTGIAKIKLISMQCRNQIIMLLASKMNILGRVRMERLVNPISETSSLSVSPQEPSIIVAKKELIPFFPRQMQSNRAWLKRIIACLSDIWSQGCHKLCNQKESEKDRQHFK